MSNYNVDNLVTVRSLISMHPERHCQDTFFSHSDSNPITDCGTTACVAGWTVAMLGMTSDDIFAASPYVSTSCIARDALGLSDEEADKLFFGTLSEEDPEAAALAMLDEFIEKGKAQG